MSIRTPTGLDLPHRAERRGLRGLTLLQFFVGGAVLYVSAFALLAGSTVDYDGLTGLIGLIVLPVGIAVVSMVLAMTLGLPLRLAPGLRRRWLANGEVTVIGATVGLLGCIVVLFVAPIVEVSEGFETFQSRDADGGLLTASWAIFAMSVAHFVWPRRWRRASGEVERAL
jgi:hypothetical protein